MYVRMYSKYICMYTAPLKMSHWYPGPVVVAVAVGWVECLYYILVHLVVIHSMMLFVSNSLISFTVSLIFMISWITGPVDSVCYKHPV